MLIVKLKALNILLNYGSSRVLHDVILVTIMDIIQTYKYSVEAISIEFL